MAGAVEGAALGAVFGVAIRKFLDEVLGALKELRDRDENLHKLEDLLLRLQPFVRELQDFAQEESEYSAAARKWLHHLQVQLKTAQGLIQDCSKDKMGLIRVRSSRKFVSLFENMGKLQSEASIAQWAAGLANTRDLKEALEQTRSDLAKIMSELEELKQRTVKISEAVTAEPQRFRTSEVMRVVSEPVFTINSQNNASSSSAPSSSTSSALASSSSTSLRGTRHWNRDSDISEPTICFGGDAVAQQLITNLIDPASNRKWVGLWAMGGAGKTFTARKVFNDERIRQHFTGRRYWVTVSKEHGHPLDRVRTLLKDLLEYIDGKGNVPDSLEDIRKLLKSRLDRDKVLLVLDDVWDPIMLKQLDLISDGRKGVILVTARDDKILATAMEYNNIIQIPRLLEEDSWKLFCHHAFFAHNKEVPKDLDKVARDVAAECKGLPLALQVIGSTMAGIKVSDWEVRMLGKSLRQEWEDALEKLKRANVGKDEYEMLYRRLQLSVDSLGEDLEHPRLQECFFYFAAFPEDFQINMEWLVTIWIAEGIVENEDKSLAS